MLVLVLGPVRLHPRNVSYVVRFGKKYSVKIQTRNDPFASRFFPVVRVSPAPRNSCVSVKSKRGTAHLRLPSVGGNRILTVGFDTQIVLSADNSRKSRLTPVTAPRVANDPEIAPRIRAVSHYRNRMVQVLVSCQVLENRKIFQAKKIVRHRYAARYRTSLQLGHHRLRPVHQSVLLHVPHGVRLLRVTSLLVACHTHVYRVTIPTCVVSFRYVRLARLVRNTPGLVDVLIRRQRVPAVAAPVVLVAVQYHLHRQTRLTDLTRYYIDPI